MAVLYLIDGVYTNLTLAWIWFVDCEHCNIPNSKRVCTLKSKIKTKLHFSYSPRWFLLFCTLICWLQFHSEDDLSQKMAILRRVGRFLRSTLGHIVTQKDWMPLIKRASIGSFQNKILFLYFYVQMDLRMYVRNVILKIPQPLVWWRTHSQGTEKQNKTQKPPPKNNNNVPQCVQKIHTVHVCTQSLFCLCCLTLPMQFRLDLCLGRNIPSQQGLKTRWDRHKPPKADQQTSLSFWWPRKHTALVRPGNEI